MLLPRIWAPTRAATSRPQSTSQSLSPSNRALEALRTAALAPLSLTFVRHATHQSEGRANGAKDGPGKRLGAKKTAEEYVVHGNILFRQRGTTWHPGENVYKGRDHTLHAGIAGYVKYYRDPLRHPKRQYIGVALNRDDKLPYPPNAARKRRLSMVAVPMRENTMRTAYRGGVDGNGVGASAAARDVPRNMREGIGRTTRSGYVTREANWEIGRTAERAGVKVREFVKGERFLAWRKSRKRIQANIEKRAMRKRKK